MYDSILRWRCCSTSHATPAPEAADTEIAGKADRATGAAGAALAAAVPASSSEKAGFATSSE